jgi:hypothetical protein
VTGPSPSASVIYLDVDDEITSAATRIRGASEAAVALVLPVGSRVSTSRINFRVLAREAVAAGRRIAIVSQEPAVRALAESAGLSAFATVVAFETAEAAGGIAAAGAATPAPMPNAAAQLRRGTRGPARTGGARPAASEPSSGGRDAGASREQTGLPADARADPVRGRRRPSALRVVLLGALLIALVVVGAAAWLFLPAATVVVTTRADPVGPLQFTVRADPLEPVGDVSAGTLSASVDTFNLSVSADFPTTGKKVTETKATGSVRWTNCDPTRSYTIPAGTVVRTSGGQQFATVDAVFLPVATLFGNPPSITCQSRSAPVTARKAGPDGNVDAGTITLVPADYNPVVVRVSNPQPTTGGTHTETRIVAQKDLDGAMTALAKSLRDQFSAQLAAPSLPPGLTLYPATRSMSAAEPSVDPATLLGDAAASITLGLSATGTATAVETALVLELANERIRGALSTGYLLAKDSVDVRLGTPRTDGAAVLFPVTARASQVAVADAVAIRRMVKGLSADEARERLRNYGDATVDLWPAWVTTITSYDARLDIRVVAAVPTESVSSPPSSSPPGSPASPAGPGSGSAGPSASPSPGAT